ncbi:MAG: hypothetical protein ACRC35_04290 [Angustibacter sp.]
MTSGYQPSQPLARWRGEGRVAIDELVAAHRAIGGTAPGRRTATRQINHALVVQVASLFPWFARDLHTACTDAVVEATPQPLRAMMYRGLTSGLALDRRNASPRSLGDDFDRFGRPLWFLIEALGPQYQIRRRRLEELNRWRNAIAHQDFTKVGDDPVTAGTRVS